MVNKELFTDNWGNTEVKDLESLKGPIFIIGASGFIGARMFYNFSQRRNDVYACSIDASTSWRLKHASKKRIIDLDILDKNSLEQNVKRIRPKTVFNMSAYGAYSHQTDPEKVHLTNYMGTLNLLRVLNENGCEAFVQAGSSSEYGLNCSGPSEGSELVPNSDYAVSKVGASYLIKYYGRILNFPCLNLRQYSIYGPWEENIRLMPNLVRKGLEGQYPNFVDKTISRDYVYVDDCIYAFVRGALYCNMCKGESINIATGVKTSMGELAKVSKEVFKVKAKPLFGSMENRKWDLRDWYGTANLAKNKIGWKAKTSLQEGLRLMAKWEKIAESEKIYDAPIRKNVKLSAIFACYKDNQSIPILYQRTSKVMRKLGVEYEIIFINDCSPYNDEEVIYGLAKNDHHVIGISHSRNFGTQSGFLSGMEISTGDAVILMDGDGQDPPELIEEFYQKWQEGYEVVYGERVRREASIMMQVFYKLFYRIFRKMAEIKIPLDAGDFSLIDRKVVKSLISLPEKDVFLRGLRAWVGYKQIGVPYVRPERLFGRSTNNMMKNIWWAKKGIFSFSTKPLQYIQTIGLTVFGITILLGIYYFVDYFVNPPKDANGITTIVLLVLGLGSVQLLSVSIIGEYIGKIIEEVKSRPRYIRRKIIKHGTVIE